MPKDKYQVYINNILRYTCVTTSRSEDDIISMLKDRYDSIDSQYIKIYKIEGENKLLLYSSSKKWKMDW